MFDSFIPPFNSLYDYNDVLSDLYFEGTIKPSQFYEF